MKELTFKPRTKARPVTIEQADAGDPVLHYELREMKASMRDKYMDKMAVRLVINSKGDVVGLKKFDGMQIDLLTQCLYAEDGQLVSRELLQEWPSGTVAQLFEAAQELNHLRKPSERNRVAAERIAAWLKDKAIEDATPEKIEALIEDADKNLFGEAKDAGED